MNGRSGQTELPVQPVQQPVICKPYEEPGAYWHYHRETGEAEQIPGRRPAGYYYKNERVGTGQQTLFLDESHDGFAALCYLCSLFAPALCARSLRPLFAPLRLKQIRNPKFQRP